MNDEELEDELAPEDRAEREEEIEKIQSNDATLTSVSVRGEFDRYGAAFRGNTNVEGLSLALGVVPPNFGEGYFALLLNWIQTSPSLQKISIQGFKRRLVPLFLQAIAENPRIQNVSFRCTRVLNAAALAVLLRSPRPKLILSFWNVEFAAAAAAEDGPPPVRVLQDALRGNTSLVSLNLQITTVQVLLPALSSCCSINEVYIQQPGHDDDDREQKMQAIQNFLQSPPTSLDHLHLRGFKRLGGGFGSILQPLWNAESVTKVTFDCCTFNQGTTNLLTNLFRANPRIASLVLDCLIEFTGPDGIEDTETQLVGLVRDNTTLKELGINLSSDEEAASVIRGLEENSTVERLELGHLNNERCSTLAKSLPKFSGVKELSFSVDNNSELSEASKTKLMQAFKRNASLTNVAIEQAPGTNVFTPKELRMIEWYTNRNTHAVAMLEAVPLSIRPKLYVAVRESVRGPTEILRDLKKLGDKVGTAGSRKRKHSDDDTTAA